MRLAIFAPAYRKDLTARFLACRTKGGQTQVEADIERTEPAFCASSMRKRREHGEMATTCNFIETGMKISNCLSC